MATNIEQIFRSFVVNKFKEIQEEKLNSETSETSKNGELTAQMSGNPSEETIADVQDKEQMQPESTQLEQTQSLDLEEESAAKELKSGEVSSSDEVKKDASRKKSKKHKKHKSKKKKKKKKKEKSEKRSKSVSSVEDQESVSEHKAVWKPAFGTPPKEDSRVDDSKAGNTAEANIEIGVKSCGFVQEENLASDQITSIVEKDTYIDSEFFGPKCPNEIKGIISKKDSPLKEGVSKELFEGSTTHKSSDNSKTLKQNEVTDTMDSTVNAHSKEKHILPSSNSGNELQLEQENIAVSQTKSVDLSNKKLDSIDSAPTASLPPNNTVLRCSEKNKLKCQSRSRSTSISKLRSEETCSSSKSVTKKDKSRSTPIVKKNNIGSSSPGIGHRSRSSSLGRRQKSRSSSVGKRKYSHSNSPVQRRKSRSNTPCRSKSPIRKWWSKSITKRERTVSISPVRRRRSRTRSVARRRRSRTRSAARKHRSRTRSVARRHRSKTRSVARRHNSGSRSTSSRRKSRSRSASRRRPQSQSGSRRRKSRSLSVSRRKRSQSRSVARRGKSRSRSLTRRRRSRSGSAARRRRLRSASDSRRQRSRSGSTSRRQRSRSGSAGRRRRSRSNSAGRRRRSRSGSAGRRRRARSGSVRRRRSRSESAGRRRRSRSGSTRGRRRSRSGSAGRRRRSRSGSDARRRRSRSGSAARRRRSRSGSAARRRRSRSGSAARRRRSRSGSAARRRRSRSGSAARRRRSRSGSATRRRRSRSGSATRRRRSRSGSAARRQRTGSRSTARRRKSRSCSAKSRSGSKKRSTSRSLAKRNGSRSASLSRRRRARSESVTKKQRSTSRSDSKRERSRSGSAAKRKQSRNASAAEKKKIESSTAAERSMSRSRSSSQRRRSQSAAGSRRSRSTSDARKRKSRSRSSKKSCEHSPDHKLDNLELKMKSSGSDDNSKVSQEQTESLNSIICLKNITDEQTVLGQPASLTECSDKDPLSWAEIATEPLKHSTDSDHQIINSNLFDSSATRRPDPPSESICDANDESNQMEVAMELDSCHSDSDKFSTTEEECVLSDVFNKVPDDFCSLKTFEPYTTSDIVTQCFSEQEPNASQSKVTVFNSYLSVDESVNLCPKSEDKQFDLEMTNKQQCTTTSFTVAGELTQFNTMPNALPEILQTPESRTCSETKINNSRATYMPDSAVSDRPENMNLHLFKDQTSVGSLQITQYKTVSGTDVCLLGDKSPVVIPAPENSGEVVAIQSASDTLFTDHSHPGISAQTRLNANALSKEKLYDRKEDSFYDLEFSNRNAAVMQNSPKSFQTDVSSEQHFQEGTLCSAVDVCTSGMDQNFETETETLSKKQLMESSKTSKLSKDQKLTVDNENIQSVKKLILQHTPNLESAKNITHSIDKFPTFEKPICKGSLSSYHLVENLSTVNTVQREFQLHGSIHMKPDRSKAQTKPLSHGFPEMFEQSKNTHDLEIVKSNAADCTDLQDTTQSGRFKDSRTDFELTVLSELPSAVSKGHPLQINAELKGKEDSVQNIGEYKNEMKSPIRQVNTVNSNINSLPSYLPSMETELASSKEKNVCPEIRKPETDVLVNPLVPDVVQQFPQNQGEHNSIKNIIFEHSSAESRTVKQKLVQEGTKKHSYIASGEELPISESAKEISTVTPEKFSECSQLKPCRVDNFIEPTDEQTITATIDKQDFSNVESVKEHLSDKSSSTGTHNVKESYSNTISLDNSTPTSDFKNSVSAVTDITRGSSQNTLKTGLPDVCSYSWQSNSKQKCSNDQKILESNMTRVSSLGANSNHLEINSSKTNQSNKYEDPASNSEVTHSQSNSQAPTGQVQSDEIVTQKYISSVPLNFKFSRTFKPLSISALHDNAHTSNSIVSQNSKQNLLTDSETLLSSKSSTLEPSKTIILPPESNALSVPEPAESCDLSLHHQPESSGQSVSVSCTEVEPCQMDAIADPSFSTVKPAFPHLSNPLTKGVKQRQYRSRSMAQDSRSPSVDHDKSPSKSGSRKRRSHSKSRKRRSRSKSLKGKHSSSSQGRKRRSRSKTRIRQSPSKPSSKRRRSRSKSVRQQSRSQSRDKSRRSRSKSTGRQKQLSSKSPTRKKRSHSRSDTRRRHSRKTSRSKSPVWRNRSHSKSVSKSPPKSASQRRHSKSKLPKSYSYSSSRSASPVKHSRRRNSSSKSPTTRRSSRSRSRGRWGNSRSSRRGRSSRSASRRNRSRSGSRRSRSLSDKNHRGSRSPIHKRHSRSQTKLDKSPLRKPPSKSTSPPPPPPPKKTTQLKSTAFKHSIGLKSLIQKQLSQAKLQSSNSKLSSKEQLPAASLATTTPLPASSLPAKTQVLVPNIQSKTRLPETNMNAKVRPPLSNQPQKTQLPLPSKDTRTLLPVLNTNARAQQHITDLATETQWPVADLTTGAQWPMPDMATGGHWALSDMTAAGHWTMPDMTSAGQWAMPDMSSGSQWPLSDMTSSHHWPLSDMSTATQWPVSDLSSGTQWPASNLSSGAHWPLSDLATGAQWHMPDLGVGTQWHMPDLTAGMSMPELTASTAMPDLAPTIQMADLPPGISVTDLVPPPAPMPDLAPPPAPMPDLTPPPAPMPDLAPPPAPMPDLAPPPAPMPDLAPPPAPMPDLAPPPAPMPDLAPPPAPMPDLAPPPAPMPDLAPPPAPMPDLAPPPAPMPDLAPPPAPMPDLAPPPAPMPDLAPPPATLPDLAPPPAPLPDLAPPPAPLPDLAPPPAPLPDLAPPPAPLPDLAPPPAPLPDLAPPPAPLPDLAPPPAPLPDLAPPPAPLPDLAPPPAPLPDLAPPPAPLPDLAPPPAPLPDLAPPPAPLPDLAPPPAPLPDLAPPPAPLPDLAPPPAPLPDLAPATLPDLAPPALLPDLAPSAPLPDMNPHLFPLPDVAPLPVPLPYFAPPAPLLDFAPTLIADLAPPPPLMPDLAPPPPLMLDLAPPPPLMPDLAPPPPLMPDLAPPPAPPVPINHLTSSLAKMPGLPISPAPVPHLASAAQMPDLAPAPTPSLISDLSLSSGQMPDLAPEVTPAPLPDLAPSHLLSLAQPFFLPLNESVDDNQNAYLSEDTTKCANKAVDSNQYVFSDELVKPGLSIAAKYPEINEKLLQDQLSEHCEAVPVAAETSAGCDLLKESYDKSIHPLPDIALVLPNNTKPTVPSTSPYKPVSTELSASTNDYPLVQLSDKPSLLLLHKSFDEPCHPQRKECPASIADCLRGSSSGSLAYSLQRKHEEHSSHIQLNEYGRLTPLNEPCVSLQHSQIIEPSKSSSPILSEGASHSSSLPEDSCFVPNQPLQDGKIVFSERPLQHQSCISLFPPEKDKPCLSPDQHLEISVRPHFLPQSNTTPNRLQLPATGMIQATYHEQSLLHRVENSDQLEDAKLYESSDKPSASPSLYSDNANEELKVADPLVRHVRHTSEEQSTTQPLPDELLIKNDDPLSDKCYVCPSVPSIGDSINMENFDPDIKPENPDQPLQNKYCDRSKRQMIELANSAPSLQTSYINTDQSATVEQYGFSDKRHPNEGIVNTDPVIDKSILSLQEPVPPQPCEILKDALSPKLSAISDQHLNLGPSETCMTSKQHFDLCKSPNQLQAHEPCIVIDHSFVRAEQPMLSDDAWKNPEQRPPIEPCLPTADWESPLPALCSETWPTAKYIKLSKPTVHDEPGDGLSRALPQASQVQSMLVQACASPLPPISDKLSATTVQPLSEKSNSSLCQNVSDDHCTNFHQSVAAELSDSEPSHDPVQPYGKSDQVILPSTGVIPRVQKPLINHEHILSEGAHPQLASVELLPSVPISDQSQYLKPDASPIQSDPCSSPDITPEYCLSATETLLRRPCASSPSMFQEEHSESSDHLTVNEQYTSPQYTLVDKNYGSPLTPESVQISETPLMGNELSLSSSQPQQVDQSVNPNLTDYSNETPLLVKIIPKPCQSVKHEASESQDASTPILTVSKKSVLCIDANMHLEPQTISVDPISSLPFDTTFPLVEKSVTDKMEYIKSFEKKDNTKQHATEELILHSKAMPSVEQYTDRGEPVTTQGKSEESFHVENCFRITPPDLFPYDSEQPAVPHDPSALEQTTCNCQPPPELLPYDSEQPANSYLGSSETQSEQASLVFHAPPELLPYDSDQPTVLHTNSNEIPSINLPASLSQAELTSQKSSVPDSLHLHESVPVNFQSEEEQQSTQELQTTKVLLESGSIANLSESPMDIAHEQLECVNAASYQSGVSYTPIYMTLHSKECNLTTQISSENIKSINESSEKHFSSELPIVSPEFTNEEHIDFNQMQSNYVKPVETSESVGEDACITELPTELPIAGKPRVTELASRLSAASKALEHRLSLSEFATNAELSASLTGQQPLLAELSLSTESQVSEISMAGESVTTFEQSNIPALKESSVLLPDATCKRPRSKSINRTNSRSQSISRLRDSRSKSVTRMKRSRSKSRTRKRSRSKSATSGKRSRSKSVAKRQRSHSKSALQSKRSRSKSATRRSRSKSYMQRRHSRSKSTTRKKRSRSKSNTGKRRSLSRSAGRKRRSRSRSVGRKRRSRSKSPVRKRRSRSQSTACKRRSRSKSAGRKKRSRSKSNGRKRRSRSTSAARRRRSRSVTMAHRRRSSSASAAHRRRSRSTSVVRRRRSRSSSVARRRRSRSVSAGPKRTSRSLSVSKRRRSWSKSVSRRRRSRSPSGSRRRRSRSASVGRRRRSRSTSVTRKGRSRSVSVAHRRRSRSTSEACKKRSRSVSATRKGRSASISLTPKSPTYKSSAVSRSDRSRSHSQSNILRKRKTRSRSSSRDKNKLSEKRRRRSNSKDHYNIKSRRRSRTPPRRKKSRSPIKRMSPVRRRRSRSTIRRKSFSRSPVRRKRSRSRDKSLDSSRSPKRLTDLDKAQLLEIAKANAAAMCAKAGMPLPSSLKPVITPATPSEDKNTLRSYGNTIQELTEKCKQIAQSKEDDVIVNKPHDSDEEEEERPFYNHPFKVSDHKPISFSLLNPSVKPTPKNPVTLTKEFPVSSGSQNTKKESEKVYGEWVPVDKKSEESKDDVFTNTGLSQF